MQVTQEAHDNLESNPQSSQVNKCLEVKINVEQISGLHEPSESMQVTLETHQDVGSNQQSLQDNGSSEQLLHTNLSPSNILLPL